MNKSNLIPNSERTPEELREMTRKGGIRSGEVRREKKMIKDQLKLLLSLPLKDPKAKKQLQELGIDLDNIDNQMAMVISMWQKAIKGDVQAFNSIRDTVGEKPIEKVEQNINAEVLDKQRNAIDDVIAQMKPPKEDDT